MKKVVINFSRSEVMYNVVKTIAEAYGDELTKLMTHELTSSAFSLAFQRFLSALAEARKKGIVKNITFMPNGLELEMVPFNANFFDAGDVMDMHQATRFLEAICKAVDYHADGARLVVAGDGLEQMHLLFVGERYCVVTKTGDAGYWLSVHRGLQEALEDFKRADYGWEPEPATQPLLRLTFDYSIDFESFEEFEKHLQHLERKVATLARKIADGEVSLQELLKDDK